MTADGGRRLEDAAPLLAVPHLAEIEILSVCEGVSGGREYRCRNELR